MKNILTITIGQIIKTIGFIIMMIVLPACAVGVVVGDNYNSFWSKHRKAAAFVLIVLLAYNVLQFVTILFIIASLL